MGQGDFMPTGGHRKYADPKRIEEIRKGGKIADQIHRVAATFHQQHDVPKAEKQLEEDLQKL